LWKNLKGPQKEFSQEKEYSLEFSKRSNGGSKISAKWKILEGVPIILPGAEELAPNWKKFPPQKRAFF